MPTALEAYTHFIATLLMSLRLAELLPKNFSTLPVPSHRLISRLNFVETGNVEKFLGKSSAKRKLMSKVAIKCVYASRAVGIRHFHYEYSSMPHFLVYKIE